MTTEQVSDAALIERLRRLIGRRREQDGDAWRLIDVLPGEGWAVLESDRARPPIQVDQYGRASHRANAIRQIPIRDPIEGGPTAEIEELIQALESQVGRAR